MSGHEMRHAEGVPPEQQNCTRCHMTHQQFIDNGRPRCPGRPHTNADLWPDIRVKPPRPDDTEWMQWACSFTQVDGSRRELPADAQQAIRTRDRLRSWAP